jgi:hypothetical protein
MHEQGVDRARQPRFPACATVLKSDGEEVKSQGRDGDPFWWDFGTRRAISDKISQFKSSPTADQSHLNYKL